MNAPRIDRKKAKRQMPQRLRRESKGFGRPTSLEPGIHGSGFRGFGFRVQGLGGLEFRVEGFRALEFRI